MNSANFIQAVRGPILLITLGVLMVIDYNTPFTFGRTWPALVIVFGLLWLLERMVGPPHAPVSNAPVPPGFQAPQGAYQGPGSYPGSVYEPSAGYQPQPQNPSGNPTGGNH